jgi:hypothetical protein
MEFYGSSRLQIPVASENSCMSPQPASQFGDLSVSATSFQVIS